MQFIRIEQPETGAGPYGTRAMREVVEALEDMGHADDRYYTEPRDHKGPYECGGALQELWEDPEVWTHDLRFGHRDTQCAYLWWVSGSHPVSLDIFQEHGFRVSIYDVDERIDGGIQSVAKTETLRPIQILPMHVLLQWGSEGP